MMATSKEITVLAVSVSALAAVASLTWLPVVARQCGMAWGSEHYVASAYPYALLIILAVAFGKTIPGAAISLIGALVVGGLGVFGTYNAGDAMSVALMPFVLYAGCGVILVTQLACWAVMRGRHQRA